MGVGIYEPLVEGKGVHGDMESEGTECSENRSIFSSVELLYATSIT